MRVLFLSCWYPSPPNNGSKLRIYNLLRGLSREHEVSLITFSTRSDGEMIGDLRGLCRGARVIPYRAYDPGSIRGILGLLSPRPRALVDTYSPLMAAAIGEQLDGGDHDLVIASQLGTAAYHEAWRGIPAIFEEVEVGILMDALKKASTSFAALRYQLTFLKLTRFLRRILPQFRACTVASCKEEMYLQKIAPCYTRIQLIPNCISLSDYAGVAASPQPFTFVFTGSLSYGPNYTGMVWFLREVFPLIRARIPRARVIITGDHADLPLPECDSVTLTGLVDDVRPIVASSWISLAPILRGGGTRLKILEAMALRTPVVATWKGAEGIEAQNGEHLLIGDQPAEFAEAVVRLCCDSNLRTRLADNAYQLVREGYAWNVVMPRFLSIMEQAAHV